MRLNEVENMKVLIIIPAYNEEESIEKVINNLKQNYSQYDYVIINDETKSLGYVIYPLISATEVTE